MLPQHLVYKNELNREYVINIARKDETPWWRCEKIETCRSGFMCLKCFKWKLCRYICWLVVELTFSPLTLILLTWRIRWAPNNAIKRQIGFNSAFKGLMFHFRQNITALFLISNFPPLLYVLCFLLGDSPCVWILYADVSEHAQASQTFPLWIPQHSPPQSHFIPTRL